MLIKLKPRKCRRCKAEFQPNKEWQKFCGSRCRRAAQNAKKNEIIRRAQKIIEAQEKGAA
jgi:hypothetical protein